MGHCCYTINNKRKQAEDRNNIKRDTYPALIYYYKTQNKVVTQSIKNSRPQIVYTNRRKVDAERYHLLGGVMIHYCQHMPRPLHHYRMQSCG